MNTLNMASMAATGGGWQMGIGMGFHGLIWLTILLAIGTVVWLFARAVGRAVINRHQ